MKKNKKERNFEELINKSTFNNIKIYIYLYNYYFKIYVLDRKL